MASRLRTAMWDRLFQRCARPGLSLQSQIRQMLVSAILDGQIPVGVPLPSSRELAEQLGVARNTVVLAYQQLVDEGYLISRERSGHFVNPDILGRKAPLPEGATGGGPAPRWSERFRFQPSRQRNIVKPENWQTFPYPFIYGQFDPSLFPTAEWRECCMKELSVMEIRDWAPDLIARDDHSLIQQIRTRVLPRRGVWASEEEIVVTVGAQQALYLLADLLVTDRTVVGMEDPGYPDARNIFASRTSRVIGLPVDEQGLPVSEALDQCDYVYVTPSHQCPTTVTLPLERREALLRRAEKADFVLIEDDYECEHGFAKEPLPALKSLDRSDRVIYIGSLSKTFAPGLRLGYIVGPEVLIREMRALRRLMLRHPSAFIQRSFALFLALGHHDAMLRRLSYAYRERAQVLAEAIDRHLPQVAHVPTTGGASCWITGPSWLDARALARSAAARGVLIEPGDVFFMADDPPRHHFRLGFSSIPVDKIEPGIQRLAEALDEQAGLHGARTYHAR
ncbi:MocR-like pyridoxine biosynthesis transcription factor PdxR [Pelomicrobium sp.]|uniref:MocR-like pyridoxine biosynthesis transcription factor PdxR n=1 Tax=Pelomicrobium sp. TaxID=2815319 RepID=UPI002FDED437